VTRPKNEKKQKRKKKKPNTHPTQTLTKFQTEGARTTPTLTGTTTLGKKNRKKNPGKEKTSEGPRKGRQEDDCATVKATWLDGGTATLLFGAVSNLSSKKVMERKPER